MTVAFDIETGALPREKLQQICKPFDPSTVPHPGSFNPADVKCGNIGGPDSEKGRAKIEAARTAHAEAVANYEKTLLDAEAKYWAEIENKAALNAVYGEVLAIGYIGKGVLIQHQADTDKGEAGILKDFWGKYAAFRKSNRKMIGFNVHEFDVPFLVRRSWILGVSVPRTIYSNGRYVDSMIIDLMQMWKGPAYRDAYIPLDTCCRACGLPGKTGDGAQFAELYRSPETRIAALEYLKHDLVMTQMLAERLGVWL